MTAADVDEMRAWHYPAPYENYDLDGEPAEIESWRSEVESGGRWFVAVDAGSDDLVGFFEFVDTGEEMEIGLGLRPDLTGRGAGAAYVEAGLAFARGEWNPAAFALDVFPWNARAIATYERAGFERGAVYIRRFDGGAEREFLRMVRRA